MADPRAARAIELMERFAVRTGLTDQGVMRRYLWTDAFAVCNFIALRDVTGDARYEALASKLVERVHDVLGPRRDPEHPTRTGLRIGKPLPERGPDEPFDEELEWERDGQYFHYLTKWMHALDRLARATHRHVLNLWARELAVAAHRAFTYDAAGHRRMYWKMSVDLSRPLVRSMGHHDPLDGYITTLWLQKSPAATLPGPDLQRALADYGSMLDLGSLATPDALGIGGLLTDAWRIGQLIERGARGEGRLFDALVVAAAAGLTYFARQQDLRAGAERRLAFRELGLAIGLAAADQLGDQRLTEHAGLRRQIEAFWVDPAHRSGPTWREHEDINEVMLATSLVPSGFLG